MEMLTADMGRNKAMVRGNFTKGPGRWILAVLLVIGLVLSATGLSDRGLHAAGLTPLPEKNSEYLERAFDQSLRLFAVLSVVKVALAVVEGSEVGVGFGLELGDLVQSVYDHVNIAWKTVLIAGVVLQVLNFLLETASFVDQWLLSLAFLLGLASLFISEGFAPRHWFRNLLSDGTMLFTVIAVTLYVVLPLTVGGARMLSQTITAPSLEKAEKGISQFERELKDQELDKVGSVSKKVEFLRSLITDKAKSLMTFLFTIIAVYVFDCVLFPLLIFFLLYRGTNLGVRYLFHLKHHHLSAHDMPPMRRSSPSS